MQYKRALRYLAPNLLTAINLIFGTLSIFASFEGRYVDAAWLIIYAVLTDRLDGFVARLVRGTSELGVQLDSFADFLNFGIAPAILVYGALGNNPELPFGAGGGRFILIAGCTCWILAATFRLARYNITSEESQPTKIFFGVPTTLMGGALTIYFLALAKYSPLYSAQFDTIHLLGDITTPEAVWRYFPGLMFLGAFLMASSLRMPKLGVMHARPVMAFVYTNVAIGSICSVARLFPEYMALLPTMWLVVFLIWGQLSPTARRMRPPPLFPEVDPPRGKEPVRPEDDLLPEGQDEPLDPENPAKASTRHA